MHMQRNSFLFAAMTAAAVLRRGADAFDRRVGRKRNAQRPMDSGLFARMDASCLSLVRVARLGPWPDNVVRSHC